MSPITISQAKSRLLIGLVDHQGVQARTILHVLIVDFVRSAREDKDLRHDVLEECRRLERIVEAQRASCGDASVYAEEVLKSLHRLGEATSQTDNHQEGGTNEG